MQNKIEKLKKEFERIEIWVGSKKKGKRYDHGTDFSININDIELLYEKIDI